MSDNPPDKGWVKPQEPISTNQQPEDPSLRSGDCAEPSAGSTLLVTPSEGASSEDSKPEPEPAPAEVVRLPTNRLDTLGEEVVITERDVAEWRPVYPGVNVDQALQKMRQWLIANRAQRKTAKGMRAFVTAWLSRDQDRCGRFGAQPGSAADPNSKAPAATGANGLPAPPDWGDQGRALSEAIGPENFAQWFGGGAAQLVTGAPVRIVVDKPYRRNWIANHFGTALATIFGDDVVIECAPTKDQQKGEVSR